MRQALAQLQAAEQTDTDKPLSKSTMSLWQSRWWSCCVAGGDSNWLCREFWRVALAAVERRQSLLATKAQQARILAPQDPVVNNFVIEVQTNNDLRKDHIVCHGCGREVIATATECPHCRAELLFACNDCGRPVAAVDDCCLVCKGLMRGSAIAARGSFAAFAYAKNLRMRHWLRAEEALRHKAKTSICWRFVFAPVA